MDKSKVFVVGAGVHPFRKKGEYATMAAEAARSALMNANKHVEGGLPYDKISAAVCSYCYGSPTCGQTALYELGLTGIPIFNTNNNCSSGSTALFLAAQLLRSGTCGDACLVVGFEEMDDTGLTEAFPNKLSPVKKQIDHMYDISDLKGQDGSNFQTDIIKVFGLATQEYIKKYKCDPKIFAEIAAKNRMHGSRNPNALFTKKTIAVDKVAASMKLFGDMTVAMAAPLASGAAAVVLCTEAFMTRNRLTGIELAGQAVVSDLPSSFSKSCSNPHQALAGVDMARRAGEQALGQAEIDIKQVELLECHDCFSPNELFMYEALGLCKDGEGEKFWNRRTTTKSATGHPICKLDNCVVNVSGGLESKGHPIGATGVAQCCEILWQMRNEAGDRQIVPAPKVSLQHNFGFNGGAVVSVYRTPMTQSRL